MMNSAEPAASTKLMIATSEANDSSSRMRLTQQKAPIGEFPALLETGRELD